MTVMDFPLSLFFPDKIVLFSEKGPLFGNTKCLMPFYVRRLGLCPEPCLCPKVQSALLLMNELRLQKNYEEIINE